MANKNFKSGLDALIQSSKAPEDNNHEAVKGQMAKGEKKVTVTIPEELKRRIKKYCAANDITIKALFIASVNEKMKSEELRVKSEE